MGTNNDTEGPKDPLPFNVKIEIMKTMYPDLDGHLVAETSWLTLASKVYEKHGNIVLNVYTDEDWVTKALVQYNGKEGAHGYYEFGTIQQQITPRLSSATALRNAVTADDRDAFSKAAGVDADTPIAGHAFFDVVKHYLMPYVAKAAAKPVKKKVKEPENDVAEGGVSIDKETKFHAKLDKLVHDTFGKRTGEMENAWDRLQREKALESAGVGIITKQNSTVDVNKNTPKKNLKAFRLI